MLAKRFSSAWWCAATVIPRGLTSMIQLKASRMRRDTAIGYCLSDRSSPHLQPKGPAFGTASYGFSRESGSRSRRGVELRRAAALNPEIGHIDQSAAFHYGLRLYPNV